MAAQTQPQYEVVSRFDPRIGVLRRTLTEARQLAEPGDRIYLVSSDGERIAEHLEAHEVRPGMRQIAGRWYYSAAWL